MATKLLDLPLLGETHKFRSFKESAYAYHGKWESGPLEGREASPAKHQREAAPVPERAPASAQGEAKARRERLLTALRTSPDALRLRDHATLHSVAEKDLRGDIGALRKAGHTIEAVGDGRFALRG